MKRAGSTATRRRAQGLAGQDDDARHRSVRQSVATVPALRIMGIQLDRRGLAYCSERSGVTYLDFTDGDAELCEEVSARAAHTTQKYPTRGLVKLIERYAVWEYGGGQRQSLFFAGGAAAPVVPDEPEQHFKELSANRGERSLDRLFNPSEDTPYELHTPVDNDDNISEPLSDLPFRNISRAGPLRESLIDLDDAAGLDLTVPTFNFDFGDLPTLKARTSRQVGREDAAEEDYDYGTNGRDERRAIMKWTFPGKERKRATMDWTFNTAVPAEPGDPEPSLKLSPMGIEGLPAGFRPTLKHTTTEPVGQFKDFRHPAQPLMSTSSPPTRDSMTSMIDLDLSLADPHEITRPSTAGSATTDLTSGNPFDLEDDPAQNARDRDRFAHHKHWQSEGGGRGGAATGACPCTRVGAV
ncbi:hypothetical protein LTR53_003408 [Teratosphaeriaceae sp. CCFEE 6253]|nr:hypothetical protein LTR53_003408 [Teratosphaeriaceae sp. CCFEE 6253]